MINKNLNLDEIDLKLISLLKEDPYLTHTQIAEIVNRSQPTIGARLKKLKRKGILQIQAGLNFKKLDIHLAFVNLSTKNPKEIMEMAKYCPFMLNAFKIVGRYNIVILLLNTEIKKLEKIVNYHFRNNPQIQEVSLDIITDITKDFILPINAESEILKPILEDGCDANCKYCKFKKVMRFST
ncbi:MAG: winged helix-turn-helix transcriptional regulator [Candidatus Thorarchaeota archaeon]